MIELWAEKELRNLIRMKNAGKKTDLYSMQFVFISPQHVKFFVITRGYNKITLMQEKGICICRTRKLILAASNAKASLS